MAAGIVTVQHHGIVITVRAFNPKAIGPRLRLQHNVAPPAARL